MFRRKTIDPFAGAEAEVARLKQRQGDLTARLRDTEATAETAVRVQREALVNDLLDSAAFQRAEAECQTALFRRDAIGDALQETQRLLAEAEAQLAAERDRAERNKVADDLLLRADAIDAAVPEFIKAASTLAALHATFADMVRKQGIRSPIFPGLNRPPEAVAFGVLHAALESVLPIQVAPRHADAPPTANAGAVVGELMTNRMRELAQGIRNGTEPVSENLPAPLAAACIEVHIPKTTIALAEPVEWAAVDGRTVQVPHGGVTVPVPIAEEVIRLGIGHPVDTLEGAAILKEAAEPDVQPGTRNMRQTRVRRGPPWRRLAVNLYEWSQAERQRLAERAAA